MNKSLEPITIIKKDSFTGLLICIASFALGVFIAYSAVSTTELYVKLGKTAVKYNSFTFFSKTLVIYVIIFLSGLTAFAFITVPIMCSLKGFIETYTFIVLFKHVGDIWGILILLLLLLLSSVCICCMLYISKISIESSMHMIDQALLRKSNNTIHLKFGNYLIKCTVCVICVLIASIIKSALYKAVL